MIRLGIGDGATVACVILLKETRFCLGGNCQPQSWLKLIMGFPHLQFPSLPPSLSLSLIFFFFFASDAI